jgi:sterol carrier protein 2
MCIHTDGRRNADSASIVRSMCCPTSDGAGCAIVCSEEFVKRHKLENQAIEIASMGMATDSNKLFDDRSSIELAGVDMTRRAAKEAFTKAGITPDDIQLIELHDCCKLPCSSSPCDRN